MLKLNATPPEPRWIEILPGARLRVLSVTVLDHIRARNDAAQVYRDNPDAEGEDADTVRAEASVALVGSYARAVVVGWEGIGDADGEAIKPTPEAIDRLMALMPAYEAFDRLVVMPALAGEA